MRSAIFFGIFVAACGGGGGGSDGPSDAGTDSGTDAGPCLFSHVTSTSGRVLGPDGDPIAGTTVGFCMRNDVTSICLAPLPVETDGTYTIDIPEDFQCMNHAVDRLLAEGMAVHYCALDLDGVDGVLAAPDFSLFPLEGPAPAFVPDTDDEITYVADDGAELTIRPSDVVVGAVETDLRMTWVDPAVSRPCFLPPEQEVVALYALGPETNVTRTGGLPARLVNHSALPEGTPVDLYTLGSLVSAFGAEPVVEGDWQKFAESTIGADGFIATPPGDGIPQLGWIGVVAR